MRRTPLLALLAVAFALPAAAAENSLYDGNDAEKETRLRRLFTPWEFALLIDADDESVRGDPAVAGYSAQAQQRVQAAKTAMLAALDGATPDYETATRELATIRSTLARPVSEAYLAASAAAAAAAPGGALTAFEAKIWDAMQVDWLPRADRLALNGRTGAVQDVRAFLRSEAKAYKDRPPVARIDYRAALAPVQASIRGVLSADEMTLTSIYAAAGMTRQPGREGAAADPRLSDPSDRAARLRERMPEGRFTALERNILASVLTDAAFADVVSGRSTLDLKKEALDAANLAMADQADPAIVAAIREKTIFKPGSLAGLRTSIPPADMSRYVCGAMESRQPQRAPPLVGGQGNARADLDASAAEADVIRVETTALPGISRYCQETAALRAAPADTRPVQPQQRMGRTSEPPGPASAAQNVAGRPTTGGGAGGGLLGGLVDGLKANAPFMIGGALGGLIVAAAVGAGPLGLAAGLALGAGVGLLLGIFGKGGG